MSDVVDQEPGQGKRTRQRDSMLLMGTISSAGDSASDEARQPQPIRIRNLSSTGLMAESQLDFRPGDSVEIGLRGSELFAGEVMWVRDGKIGIRFREEIDHRRARRPLVARSDSLRRGVASVDLGRRPGLRIG